MFRRAEPRETGRKATPRFRAARRRFARDRKGAVAIEFAMVIVPFLGLLAAIFQTGLFYFQSAQLQTATELASRAVLTHTTASGLTYQNFVDTYVCPNLSSMFKCSSLSIDIRSPANWAAADMTNNIYASPNPLTNTINMPAAGQIAVVRIAYPIPAYLAIIAGNFAGALGKSTGGQVTVSGAKVYMIMGVAAFMVEPS
jgi:Flp pilus assembly protein TadG